MTEEKVVVTSDAGVHARPAMMLVQEAMKYPCEIYLIKDNVEANGKSIMSVLGLAITPGSRITVKAEGDQEQDAVRSIILLFKNNFKNN